MHTWTQTTANLLKPMSNSIVKDLVPDHRSFAQGVGTSTHRTNSRVLSNLVYKCLYRLMSKLDISVCC